MSADWTKVELGFAMAPSSMLLLQPGKSAIGMQTTAVARLSARGAVLLLVLLLAGLVQADPGPDPRHRKDIQNCFLNLKLFSRAIVAHPKIYIFIKGLLRSLQKKIQRLNGSTILDGLYGTIIHAQHIFFSGNILIKHDYTVGAS